MARKNSQTINYFEADACQYCGTRDVGLSEHHLIRRSERPDLINDKEVKVWLCQNCHTKAEMDHRFYKQLQEIFLSKKYLKKVNYQIWSRTNNRNKKLLQRLSEALKKKS